MNNPTILNELLKELFEKVNELNQIIDDESNEYDKSFWSGYQAAHFNIAEQLRYLMSKISNAS